MTSLVGQILAIDTALDANRVPHAFGGALALAFYTREPRGTRDIDVNVFVSEHTARTTLAAFPPDLRWGAQDTRRVERDGQVRVYLDETPVDIFFSYAPLHERAREHVRRVPFAGTEIPILGPDELAIFKAAFSRPKDWVDLQGMLAAGTLDAPSVAASLGRLFGDDHACTRRFHKMIAGAEGDRPANTPARRRASLRREGPSACETRCGVLLPIAQRPCRLPSGHRGRHR